MRLGQTGYSRRETALWAVVVTLVWCLLPLSVRAQQEPHFSHYWQMEPQYNPSAAGSLSALRLQGVYSMQLVGFKNAPRTMYAAADVPFVFLHSRHGVGASFLNDELGLFSHKRFTLQYAFHLPLWGGHLSLGVQGDMLSESFDGSKVDLEDANDPAFAKSKSDGSAFDLGAGLFFRTKRWWAGLSAIHLMAPTVDLGETNELKVDPCYYFTAGCNIPLRVPFISVRPSVLCQYDGTELRADITARVAYEREGKSLYGGVGYSPSHSVTLLLGGVFHGVNLGYSYEAYTSMPTLTTSATHELAVTYLMDLNLTKKGRNLHKSVRWL